MNRHPVWPFSSFWYRTQHAAPGFDPLDVPGPRELNPYERLLVRLVFAETKLIAFTVCVSVVIVPPVIVTIAFGFTAGLVAWLALVATLVVFLRPKTRRKP